jgi:hypothetical protein
MVADSTDEGWGCNVPQLNWAQTANHGVVPNPHLPMTFFAAAHDLADPWASELYRYHPSCSSLIAPLFCCSFAGQSLKGRHRVGCIVCEPRPPLFSVGWPHPLQRTVQHRLQNSSKTRCDTHPTKRTNKCTPGRHIKANRNNAIIVYNRNTIIKIVIISLAALTNANTVSCAQACTADSWFRFPRLRAGGVAGIG